MGAAGAVELIAAINALRHGFIPPTANFSRRIHSATSTTPSTSRGQREVEAALSNSFAFGGLNAVLALRRA
ncbi:MAG: hypothetical protein WDO12_14115 [Pseudomonadota bacterium]